LINKFYFQKKNYVLLLPLLFQVQTILFSYAATIAAESALRRSRVEAEIAASRVATDAALRRSRI
jgi:hypothetical protein